MDPSEYFYDLNLCLVPLTLEHGPLALCRSSHQLGSYDRLLHGTEEIPESFLPHAPHSQWDTPYTLLEGDFILFHNRVLHASLPNQSEEYRCSVDTRWATQEDFDRGNGV